MLVPVPSSWPNFSKIHLKVMNPSSFPSSKWTLLQFFHQIFNVFLVSATMSSRRGLIYLWFYEENNKLQDWKICINRPPPTIHTCPLHPWFHYPNNPTFPFYWTLIHLTILTILSNFYRSWWSLPYANILNCSLTSSPFRSQYFLHTYC
jgi:hypothetical protein